MEDDPEWGSYRPHPDRARFGLFYLRKGSWEDRPIVPAEWVAASRRVHMDVPYEPVAGHRLSWWIPSGPLQGVGTDLASGAGGQSIIILPELDIVFVCRASAILDRGINGLEVRDILMRLLDARTREARQDPDLVPWTGCMVESSDTGTGTSSDPVRPPLPRAAIA